MQSEIRRAGQESARVRTFIEEARRAQIIKSTVDVLADLGFARTSLAEIARRAGISKGVIHYHFHGKRELIEEVIAQTFKQEHDWTQTLLEKDVSASTKLKAYIDGNVVFIKTNPRYLKALLEIFQNYRRDDGAPFFEGTDNEAATLDFLGAVLQQGQEAGEFRPFSTPAASMAIRGAVEVMPMRRATDPNFDLDAYGAELFELFWRAFRADDAVLPEAT
ncbi:MAG: TetR/AcrR family transcriptional regulator [Dehalococcoidia bacterium]